LLVTVNISFAPFSGLRLGIQNQIATMPYRQPADTDPDAWYKAVWRIDQTYLANEVFQFILHSATSILLKTASAQLPPLSLVRLPPILPLPATPKPPPPTPSMEVPMDVNTTRKARSLPLQGCYQCGDVNYLVRDCLHHMDICQLTSEQQEELIENLLALKDAVLLKEFCSPEEEENFA